MTLISTRQKTNYRWHKGDLIPPLEAAELCGYKSAKQFQDPERRKSLGYDFTVVWQGGRMFFLRSEVDDYITRLVEKAREQAQRRKNDLGISA